MQSRELDIAQYVGITLQQSQYQLARRRLKKFGWLDDNDNFNGDARVRKVQVFCCDAARPAEWNEELQQVTTSPRSNSNGPSEKGDTWVLALDTLYHFQSSREPIFAHAFSTLRASMMAFDLLLADYVPVKDRMLLRLVARLSSTPYSNFLTENQYRAQLAEAGYDAKNIEVRDISDRVFLPLTAFLDEHEKQLTAIGLALGRYEAARWVFRWWGRSGIVRACIVVARR